jgi:hypothetical protein
VSASAGTELTARDLRASCRAARSARLDAETYCVSGGVVPFRRIMDVARELVKYYRADGALLRELFPCFNDFVNEILAAPGVTFTLSPEDATEVVVFLCEGVQINRVDVLQVLRVVMEIVRTTCREQASSYCDYFARRQAAQGDNLFQGYVDISEQIYIAVLCGTVAAVDAIVGLRRAILNSQLLMDESGHFNADIMYILVVTCAPLNDELVLTIPSGLQLQNMMRLRGHMCDDIAIDTDHSSEWVDLIAQIRNAISGMPAESVGPWLDVVMRDLHTHLTSKDPPSLPLALVPRGTIGLAAGAA